MKLAIRTPCPRRPQLAAIWAIVSLTACGSSNTPAGAGAIVGIQRHPSPTAHLVTGAPAHIAVIVMENEEYSGIIGSPSAPYVNSLARRYALATGMYAITHPSLPNYLALTGGSTFGIDSDCTGCAVRATSIVDQLERADLSWRAYMEDLPEGRAGTCFTSASAGEYAKKHDPVAYYTRITDNQRRCTNIVPLARLAADEAGGTLPRYLWITPNLCNDMHDCPVSTGDRFLSMLVPPLLRSLGKGGLLFLTWDEGSSDSGCCRLASGGHIVTIVAGPGARAGARLATPADHYSVLQTIEDLLGLARLRGAACACTPSLQPMLAGPRG